MCGIISAHIQEITMTEETKYLKKANDGTVYIWTETLSKRNDMFPCDKHGNRIFDISMSDGKKELFEETEQMEIFGKNFDIPLYLLDVVKKLVREKVVEPHIEEMQPLVIGKNEHMVPERLISDISGIVDRMVSAEAGCKDFQEKLSKLIKEKNELEKAFNIAQEEITGLKNDIKNLKKK
jgi:hypothetical protein